MTRIIPLLLLSFSGILSTLQAETAAVYHPKSADLYVLQDGQPYLTFEYYDWGPGWSGVKRKLSSNEQADKAQFHFENTLQQTKVSFDLKGSWTKTNARSLQFDAALTPSGDSELVMSQYSMLPGEAFRNTEVQIHHADGSVTSSKIPFGRGSMGDDVTRLVLSDQDGQRVEFQFSQPTSIAMDGAARLNIAQTEIKAGKTEQLGFEMVFPETLAFYPGPQSGASESSMEGWFEFSPPETVPADSMWSAKDWLEAPAGKHGRITSKDDQLIYNGAPIKLWGLNVCYASCAPDKALADKRADFYASLGINTVRLHKYADGTGWAGILSKESAVEYDQDKLDDMDYFVAALKKRGIYVKLSPVFIIDIGPGDRDRIPYMDELGPLKGNRINPKHGSLYVSTELQDLLIDQVVKLLNHTNPYTGMTYAEDPAVAYLEIYNEDSSLFGGVSRILATSPTLRKRSGADFAAWLKAKYGSKEAFLAAWGENALNNSVVRNQKIPTDESWEENRIYPAGNPWFFDPDNLNSSQAPHKTRLLDTMAYLYELQNGVYDRYTTAIRKTGYDGEMVASNWQAGRMMSHFYNLHSDARIGTIDRHNYFGGGARGGGLFNSSSMLARAGSGTFSSGLQQVNNRPFMLSEWIHVSPNEYGVEGPAIIGAYGMGLQGWDVSYAFQNRDTGTFSPAIGLDSWDVTAPNFAGILPAVSRQVLRGDVQESEVIHTRNVHLDSLPEQKVGFDEKVKQDWDIKSFDSDVFPAEALAAVRGVVQFTDSFQATETLDLSPYKQSDGSLRSSTGQLRWTQGADSQDGFIQINTDGTQAVVGFVQNREFTFQDASITTHSPYAAIYLSAQSQAGKIRDDQILISALARARNKGQVVIEDTVLVSKGEIHRHKPVGPVMMEPVRAEITLSRPGTPTVHLLDHGGRKTGKTLPVSNGIFQIDTGRDATPYYLVEYP